MSYLINSFDEFVENETIKFTGRDHIASCRLRAFKDMLKASSDLISVVTMKPPVFNCGTH
jgi:hypothetical protein